jgi:hypothetical protein
MPSLIRRATESGFAAARVSDSRISVGTNTVGMGLPLTKGTEEWKSSWASAPERWK